ncbi:MAG: hypothetical protein J6P69_02660, partial [Bacteroidales bacterium]|nr:hypothetical protein [Bacteroidales bacterium]
DPNYDDRIPDYFQNRVSYYFVKDGEIRSVKRWRELVSAYPGIKKDLKRYAKSVKDEYSRFDVLAPAILKYAEGNE